MLLLIIESALMGDMAKESTLFESSNQSSFLHTDQEDEEDESDSEI
jgi:hypothetical protein